MEIEKQQWGNNNKQYKRNEQRKLTQKKRIKANKNKQQTNNNWKHKSKKANTNKCELKS